jgi:TRAP-type C4-dicarboxylate transport system permease small subunit
MNAIKIVAIVLIVAGILALVYGGFTYTQKTHETHLGPFEVSVKETKTVALPIWVGIGAVVGGGALLLFGPKKT